MSCAALELVRAHVTLREVALKAFLVLVAEIEATGEKTISWSYPEWSQKTGCSRAALITALSELEKTGLVTRTHGGGAHANLYTVPRLNFGRVDSRDGLNSRRVSKIDRPNSRRVEPQVTQTKEKKEAKPNGALPVPTDLLTNKENYRNYLVSKYGLAEPLVNALELVNFDFCLPISNPRRKLVADLLGLPAQYGQPAEALAEVLREIREDRPGYEFNLWLLRNVVRERLAARKLKEQRKPNGRSEKRAWGWGERSAEEAAADPRSPDEIREEEIRVLERILKQEPNHAQVKARLEQLLAERPALAAAGGA